MVLVGLTGGQQAVRHNTGKFENCYKSLPITRLQRLTEEQYCNQCISHVV